MMRIRTLFRFAVSAALLLAAAGFTQPGSFIGQWAITIYGPGAGLGSSAGWLDVRQESGFLDADLLWRWGSVEPASSVLRDGDKLVLTRNWDTDRKDGSGKVIKTQTLTSWFEMETVQPDVLVGSARIPDGPGRSYETFKFVGRRMAPVPPAPDLSRIKYGKPVRLFNGKDLAGWTLVNPMDVNGWKTAAGELVNDPVQKEGQPHIPYGNLRTVEAFGDFKLAFQVNVPAGSNSGIYLRGLYEVQVADTWGKPLDPHNMGAVYSRLTPSEAAEKPAGEWQDMVIVLCHRHVSVTLNGKTVIDNKPVPGVTGGALSPDVEAKGPLYLQGDHGRVLYRNVVLTPILD